MSTKMAAVYFHLCIIIYLRWRFVGSAVVVVLFKNVVGCGCGKTISFYTHPIKQYHPTYISDTMFQVIVASISNQGNGRLNNSRMFGVDRRGDVRERVTIRPGKTS